METYHGYVKTTQDAIILFEACRIGYLSRIQRRLSEKERSAIRSGSVFVWDEREAGMRRWTDGKSWSASRVSGSFLTYRELESKRKSNSRGSNNLNDLSSEDTDSSESYSVAGKKIASATEQCRYKHGGLVKQSFSITTTSHQKLHLICYYTKADVIGDKLQIPMLDEKLKAIVIPKGMYPETPNVEGQGHGHYPLSGVVVHPHNLHHLHHQHSHPSFGSTEARMERIERSLSPNPYGWQLPHPHTGSLPNHSTHQPRSSGPEPMQIDRSHSACSTPSISSSPSTTEEEFGDFYRRQHSGLGGSANGSSQSLALYPPPNYIQPSENAPRSFTSSAPINIPAPSRFTFPPPQQIQFASSFPPHMLQQQNGQQLPPQDIPWEKIRSSEDERQLNAIYNTLKL